MFDLGFFELLVIGVVALIVVGPKDLPKMFRMLGKYTGQAKAMAREFTSAMNQAADESGMRDIQKDLRTIANPGKAGLDAIKDATGDLDKWDPMADADPLTKSDDASKADAKPADGPRPVEGPQTAALRAKLDQEGAAVQAQARAKSDARAEVKPDPATAQPAPVTPSAVPPESTP